MQLQLSMKNNLNMSKPKGKTSGHKQIKHEDKYHAVTHAKRQKMLSRLIGKPFLLDHLVSYGVSLIINKLKSARSTYFTDHKYQHKPFVGQSNSK